ncbi:unnamed protein product [Diamesa serratosioi]
MQISRFIIMFAKLCTINQIKCTCVLESDFGFAFNCNFKNSGLFRVRNLGGVKAHFGLGFSVGDELGFPESLGNVEGSKRRALNLRTGANNIGVLPAAKMPKIQQSRPQALTSAQQYVQQFRPQQMTSVQPQQYFQHSRPQAMTSPQQYRSSQRQTITRPRPIVSTPQGFRKASLMTQATSLPLGVPAFRPMSQETIKVNKYNNAPQNTIQSAPHKNHQMGNATMRFLRHPANQAPVNQQNQNQNGNNIVAQQYPPFQTLPTSVSRISQGPVYQIDNHYNSPQDQQLPQIDLKGHTVEELAIAANVTVEVIRAAIKMRQKQMMIEQKNYAIQMQQQLSVQQQQQQLSAQQQQPTVAFTSPRPTTQTTKTIAITTTTTTKPFDSKKVSNRPLAGGHKVMNAPKEYYPVGYDKNFDDHFVSKVDLPGTSFHCGDQKHFPGLYGDEDLGCMVFHVCALTDDGLIMKSFLCPESTLFDQTIMKCNWWFYTECKNSKALYDSNLPVSKSYQLMKALSFFSKYKKNNNGTITDGKDGNGLDVEALQNSVDASNVKLNPTQI